MTDSETKKVDSVPSSPVKASNKAETRTGGFRLRWEPLTVVLVVFAGFGIWNFTNLDLHASHWVTAPGNHHSKEHTILSVLQNDSAPLDQWIHYESIFAWNRLFLQIGAPAGAHEGLVIASPSTYKPDYFYTWTRDSAIVTSTILQHYLRTGDLAAEANLRMYAYSQAALQVVCNPSGCFDGDAGGLGEPKFHVNGSAFTESWGRPQRDGPALRAITLIDFANHLLDRGGKYDIQYVTNHLYKKELPAHSVIKADLEYVSKRWSESSFDLWEEIDGHHFFTFIVSRTALEKGAKLARRLSDLHASEFYASQAVRITKELQKFISTTPEHQGIVLAALNNEQWGRKGLDAAILLGVLIGGAEGKKQFGPANDAVLGSLKVYVDSFRDVYKINRGEKVKPVATGRYAEDIYDGIATSEGNPWYLTTLSVSHPISPAIEKTSW
ncbi:hypothetical protein FRC03_008159 [Tulasnella sp. 419]|nr:hypothetical protein FRC03_008159 [Tulasnella sp. 419]